MKKFFLLYLLVFTTIISCKNEIESPTFNTGVEETFTIGVDYQANNNQLKFKISEINDSRCPSDVQCVWEGKADLKIEMESPVKGNIELSTYQNKTDTLGNFAFQLINVSPYPVSTKTISLNEYNVTLKIVELND